MTNALVWMFGAPAIGAVLAAGWVWSGFVLSILWGWFIVPLFGAPALSVPEAIGLAIVAGRLAHHPRSLNGDDMQGWKAIGRDLTLQALRPAFALLVGWIVTFWI